MTDPLLLLTVAHSFRVPGLGVLAIPADPARTQALRRYALHTALEVVLALPDGRQQPAVATVEELAHGGREQYVLLLEIDFPGPLPVGSEVWLKTRAEEQA